MNIRLTPQQKIKVTDPSDIWPVMRQVLLRENRRGRKREHFWGIGIDDSNRLTFVELLALGAHNRAIIDPGDVFWLATHKEAKRMIVCHNHPGSDLSPSEADKDLTDHLYHAGVMTRVELLDHLIINEEAYFSFTESGLMAWVRKSKKYQLGHALEEQAREEGREAGIVIGTERGIRQGLERGIEKGKEIGVVEGQAALYVEMAKRLLGLGKSVAEVAELLGVEREFVVEVAGEGGEV